MSLRSAAAADGQAGIWSAPLTDLHVHLDNSTLDLVLALSGERGVKFGIVEHAGTKENVYPKVLSKEQRTDARELIEGRLSGAVNAGKPAILEADMEVGTIGINPKDAQLLESRSFSVEEICRWFGVPPHMVGHSEKSTSWGTGIEQQVLGFLTFTLMAWMRRIEQAISKDLLSPADRLRFYPKFNVEGLLRADSAGRAAFYGAMVDKGIYTRDEVREKEDLPPMGGNAAVLMTQTAMAPLDTLGQSTVGDQAKNALASWLRDE